MKSRAHLIWTVAIVSVLCFGPGSCGGNPKNNLCDCTPDRPATDDYRHAEKHVPIPAAAPVQITVSTMLSWAVSRPPDGTPRNGRELQVFEVSNAYVQFVGLNPGDCDLHVEISDTPDKASPRVIVETPGQMPTDSGYCSARQNLQNALAQHGVTITGLGQEVDPALPADVVGLAFQDFEHTRGTQFVKTTWELHPAIVTLH